jgi:hypothetical protein
MTCEIARARIVAAGDAAWPSGAQAHLAGCEDCAAFVVEWTLGQAPPVAIPATFAVDVARRARLEAEPASRRSRALTVGLVAAAVLLAAAVLAWSIAPDGSSAALPAAIFLLACGEAIVLAAWSLANHPVAVHSQPRS